MGQQLEGEALVVLSHLQRQGGINSSHMYKIEEVASYGKSSGRGDRPLWT
jgi:hypothetical protein